MCCVCLTLVAELHLPLAWSPLVALFAYCRQCLLSVLLLGQSVYLEFQLGQARFLLEYSSTELQGALLVLFPEKLLLVGEMCGQTRYAIPAHCRSSTLNGLCGFLPLSPGQLWCSWEGVGVVLTPVGDACILPHSWNHFGWTFAESVLEGVGSQENVEVGMGVVLVMLARFALFCFGRKSSYFENSY